MKDLITTIASILVLMMFLLQFTANQRTFTEIAGAENAIKIFRITAESTGNIREETVDRMQTAVSAAAGCDPSEIETVLEPDKGGEGYTSYQIRIPIRGIIGAAHMLGLSRAENTLWHTSSGIIASPPKKEEEPEPPKDGELTEEEVRQEPGEKKEQEEHSDKEQLPEREDK